MAGEYQGAARFLRLAMTEIGGLAPSPAVRLLDLGCGSGDLIGYLLAGGYDAYGCDIKPFWRGVSGIEAERFAEISPGPYRLPFDNERFDAVLSTSVLEHAQNKTEIFREVHRVLKPGGYSMHLYPGKWYLPAEPHIYVPLVNFFWPRCPQWWLALWAMLGVRNEHQQGMGWREVVRRNREYCRTGLSYWSNRRYRRVSMQVFGNHASPMVFFIENSYGGVARLLHALPLKRFTGWVAGEIRMRFKVGSLLSPRYRGRRALAERGRVFQGRMARREGRTRAPGRNALGRHRCRLIPVADVKYCETFKRELERLCREGNLAATLDAWFSASSTRARHAPAGTAFGDTLS